ncbi:MAG: SbcC/MukB-like Walker B domain-containing protein, partial [Longimicrobiales bacterium]
DQREARRKELSDAEAAVAAAAARVAELERSHAEAGYDETAYRELEAAYEAGRDEARRAELRQTEAMGRLETAEAAAVKASDDVGEDRKRRGHLDALESEMRHHQELDAAFAELRVGLNARVRPELGDLASRFLTEITDGRYTNLEIDDDYNVLVLDEGEEKPVISGGEEDVANLVLRLAISQMIAERAGHPLSILILDEVFGSLDVERRDNVIQLLHRLSDRFEQVILITHVETVRDGLDTVVRVEFDERSGASVVRQEAVEESQEVLAASY